MQALLAAAPLLVAATLPAAVTNDGGACLHPVRTAACRGVVDYDVLDQASQRQLGYSFHAYMLEAEPVRALYPREGEFRAFFRRTVDALYIGDYGRELAIYTLFAREARPRQVAGSGFVLPEFSGMNVPHRLVVALFNSVFPGLEVDDAGQLTGAGTLRLAPQAGHDGLQLVVDLGDTRSITPALAVFSGLGDPEPVHGGDVAQFLRWYLEDETALQRDANGWQSADEQVGIRLFARQLHLPTIRHEVFHALYLADPAYRRHIHDRARASDTREREMAVLFTAIGYAVLDPEMAAINPDIVLDEAYNAYRLEGVYDVQSGQSSFSIGEFVDAYGVELSLAHYRRIAELPISAGDSTRIHALFADLQSREPSLTEQGFLHREQDAVLRNIGSMALLRELLMEQDPAFHERVRQAAVTLVDERLEALS